MLSSGVPIVQVIDITAEVTAAVCIVSLSICSYGEIRSALSSHFPSIETKYQEFWCRWFWWVKKQVQRELF